jgi:succinyl-diaminopimelate desuccinylase
VSFRGGGTANIIPGFAEAVIAGADADFPGRASAEERLSRETGARITFRATPLGLSVRAEGRAAHASRPQDGVNAQTALLHALANAGELPPLADAGSTRAISGLARLFPHGDCLGEAMGLGMSDDISGELTLSFNVLNLGGRGFTANFDSRTPAAADARDIEGAAETALRGAGFRVTERSKTPCHHTPADSPLAGTLLNIYREHTGDADSKPLALGGTTYVHGIPGGVAFGTELPGRGNRIHGRDEFIGVSELRLSAAMFARAVVELCAG